MSPERTGTSPADANRREERPQRQVVILRGVALVATIAAAAAAVTFRTAPERSVAVQCGCLLAASLWVVALGREAWRGRQPVRLRPLEWLPGVALLVLAFLLRSRMLSYLPLPDRTGFEELQMGADGYKVLTSSILPLEFRFTKALAALGLAWGGATLDALRLPFQIMGYARLAVLYLCLRGLGVSWWPSAFVTITAAVSRWFVIGSGVAYEDFSPTLVLLLLLLCLIKVDLQRASAAAWAAGAGVMAGLLLFENSSFRFAVLLGAGWLLWLAIPRRREATGHVVARWRPLGFFLVTLVMVASPMVLDVAQRGSESIFFEAVTRYAKGRPSILAPVAWENLGESAAMLAGWPVETGSLLARASGHAVHPLTGGLFALAALWGLFRPGKPIVRAFVLAAVLATVVCSVTTNNFQPTRLAPVVSIMLLPVGSFLQSIQELVERLAYRPAPAAGLLVNDHPPRNPQVTLRIRAATAIVYTTLSVFKVQASAARIGRMAGDRAIWREYANDQYVTALYLAREARPGSHVLVVTPQLERIWSRESIAYWVYAEKRLRVEGAQELPVREAIGRGTLVVIGAEGRALRVDEIERLRALAKETNSLATIDLYRGRGDRILVASVCVGCNEDTSSSGAR